MPPEQLGMVGPMDSFTLHPGLYEVLLSAPNCPSEKAARVVEAIQEVWRRIAEAGHRDDLDTIQNHWSQDGAYPFLIVLGASQGWGSAETGPKAEWMRFDYLQICSFPNLAWPILAAAHELAHVWLYATKDVTHLGERPTDGSLVSAWNERREQCAR